MTLATHMWVLDPIDIDALWPVGRALIHEFSTRDGQAEWTDEANDPRWGSKEGSRQRSHRIGQGFCSMYDIDYMPGGALLHDGTVTHDEYCDDPCDYSHSRERISYYAEIRFDTAYGYNAPRVGGCGDLHAAMVESLGTWLDQRGVGWCWENEFTGEIHQGREGLDELGAGGHKAAEWFLTAALPAILTDIAASAS